MQIYVSLVIADSTDVRITVATDKEILRQDLIELFNDWVADGGLDPDVDQLPDDAPMDEVIQAFSDEVGRQVLIEDSWLIRKDERDPADADRTDAG
jgi:hypothetical protein